MCLINFFSLFLLHYLILNISEVQSKVEETKWPCWAQLYIKMRIQKLNFASEALKIIFIIYKFSFFYGGKCPARLGLPR